MQTTRLLHAASRTLLEITFKMKHSHRISSSVEIDVIESSRVVRPEHLLEFYFACLALLNFSYAGIKDRLLRPD